MTVRPHPFVRWFAALLLALLLVGQAHAQGQVSFQYFYDELGQLTKVVDSTGTVIEYVYDEVGNILEIKRTSATGLAVFNFTPSRGPVGTTVTIQGQGFSANPADNIVRFNGTPAEVISATPATLVAVVPVGATTGPITATVGAATAESSQDFTVTQESVAQAPVITSISPKSGLAGTSVADLQVTGVNLAESHFFFFSLSAPPLITIGTTSINLSGTLATLNLTIGNTVGRFVLVAVKGESFSDITPSIKNTFSVVDPSTVEQDSDGDGFPNGLEVLLGSDPFDPQSIPTPETSIHEVVGPIFSTVNSLSPTSVTPVTEAAGPIFSVVNSLSPTSVTPVTEAVGPIFSVENQGNP